MGKLLPVLVFGLAVLGFALTCTATTYTVGDTSGWDISTDLRFQYSSSNSVSQVSKESFESCNTTNVVKSYTRGNKTVALTHPGDWYFVSDNKL
ncbi:PREDICTED: blue copper protein [Prunus mume]|uniref:Blue copper protein n=1 Tax=Prunus mume TaxID=102107 RepID=A0ABM0P533_PRUMU|nr:PREDICTED: blue copper protein [Prunus mume]